MGGVPGLSVTRHFWTCDGLEVNACQGVKSVSQIAVIGAGF